ncbi:hypothetical protein OESDEN_06768 [Oesophagostomum dentatum]|uniref:Uncharacterized protein n=1 Tax=Oesophagostomum dentatum TaxID=61180 RepID=A0A0B1T6Y5_OESDE|nr:hypothetical protein OESDEN_06768 [Oesophagostomum dentatum]
MRCQILRRACANFFVVLGSTKDFSALRMAALQFQTESDRSNARNVIVLMAASYYAGGVYGASEVASQFKEDNGVLIVYNYVEEHGFAESKLQVLASPGYFLNNTGDEDGDGIRRALCDGKIFESSSLREVKDFLTAVGKAVTTEYLRK